MQMLIPLLAAAAVATAGPLLWWALASDRSVRSNVRDNLSAGLGPPSDLHDLRLRASASERAVQPVVAALAARARRLTPWGLAERLEQWRMLAGANPTWPVERILALKLLLGAGATVAFVSVMLFYPSPLRFFVGLGLTALAFFAPDVYLHSRGLERQDRILLALPDTLDQMTVAVEAGLGFDAAMTRAGRSGEGPLADELIRTLQDMQIGRTRREALLGLLDRTDVSDLRQFVHAVLQAEQHGVPIAQVLRVQASELRLKRRQRAEERAMKIPVKVLFPLVFCIFPTLFIVILGPAGIRIARLFSTVGL